MVACQLAQETGLRWASEIDTIGNSAILTKYRLQFWEVKPTMERGHRWGRIPPGKRKTQEIQMGVNDVEVGGVSQSLLHLHHHRRIAVEDPLSLDGVRDCIPILDERL